MLRDEALKDVIACLNSCDELINGKFIFAENIIVKILKNISESKEIYGLIAECMKNFDFDKEFNRAKVKLPTKDGYFIMPESKAIVLPLVFCILVDIRDKKINFHEFLKNYFTSENMNEFENFAQTLIVPFKETIAYCFEIDSASVNNETTNDKNIEEEQKQENKENEQLEQVNVNLEDKNDEKLDTFLSGVKIILNQINSEISSVRKINADLKDDSLYLINAMLICCENKDINNLSAYIVALSYVLKPIKGTIFLVRELKTKLMDFFEN